MAHIHEKIDHTASVYMLHPSEPKILLLFHDKIQKWLQPGGHIELHENHLECIQHEIEEETGLTPADWELIYQPPQPKPRGNITIPVPFHINQHDFNESHQHIDNSYLGRAKTDKLTENPDGASSIGWFALSQITELYDKGEVFDGTYDILCWIFETHVTNS